MGDNVKLIPYQTPKNLRGKKTYINASVVNILQPLVHMPSETVNPIIRKL